METPLDIRTHVIQCTLIQLISDTTVHGYGPNYGIALLHYLLKHKIQDMALRVPTIESLLSHLCTKTLSSTVAGVSFY